MNPVSDDVVASAAEIIGTAGLEEEEIEKRVRELVDDDMTARRLIDWIPEAFGHVLVSHVSTKLVLPATFSAKTKGGKWLMFELTVEPIFGSALRLAQRIYQEGTGDTFRNVSLRSSIVSSVNNALNAGANLDGCSVGGPALIGIPAEIYPAAPKSVWQRLFSR